MHAVIHLVYTAGHHAPTEQGVRTDLCEEALHLARLVRLARPDEAAGAFRSALALAPSEPERRHLHARLASLRRA